MLQKVVAHRVHPITEAELFRLLHEVRDSYRRIVPAEAFPWPLAWPSVSASL